MSDARDDFFRHLAQTSNAPIGLEITHAEGSWLHARDGRRYLDLIAGIGVAALGHGHPAVLQALTEQARRHLHVMVYGEYVIASQARLAARLAEVLPTSLDRVYFTNSGTEAIEGALKTTRKFTGRQAFVAFDGAYHGDTMGALALAGNAAFRAPFGVLPGPVCHLPYGDAAALGEAAGLGDGASPGGQRGGRQDAVGVAVLPGHDRRPPQPVGRHEDRHRDRRSGWRGHRRGRAGRPPCGRGGREFSAGWNRS